MIETNKKEFWLDDEKLKTLICEKYSNFKKKDIIYFHYNIMENRLEITVKEE